MKTESKTKKETGKSMKTVTPHATAGTGRFFGELYSFNHSLKLFHWTVSGKGSYAQHMALDQALGDLTEVLDRIVETTLAMRGDVTIVIPETKAPENIVAHCEKFFAYVDEHYAMFSENFASAILDDYQEAIQQLLYRLKRLQ